MLDHIVLGLVGECREDTVLALCLHLPCNTVQIRIFQPHSLYNLRVVPVKRRDTLTRFQLHDT